MTDAEPFDAARAALTDEQRRLTAEIAEIASLETTSPQNFDDASEVLTEHEEDQILTGELESFLGEVEAALGRLDDGTFGICESCQQPISAERLEALPTARRCMACAASA